MKLRIVQQQLQKQQQLDQQNQNQQINKEQEINKEQKQEEEEEETLPENPIEPEPEKDEEKELGEEAGEEEEEAEDDSPLLVSGKRKRKPKLNEDEATLVRHSNKKPPTPPSKPPTEVHENGEGMMSNGDGIVCALGTPNQSKSPVLLRAEDFQARLGKEQLTFLKILVRSHVGSCFWMGLPTALCRKHLPKEDCTAILVNENGEEFPIKYIANKTGLSAGWRKFVTGNKLVEGDVLVFQLIGTCKFKVYSIRANNMTDVDGALSLLVLDSQTKQSDTEGTTNSKSKKKRPSKSLPLAIVQDQEIQDQNQNEVPILPQLGQPDEHSGSNIKELTSEVMECSKFSDSAIQFKDVTSFEEFHIVVNGVCIDSELPENIRRKYYEICISKNAFLHDNILPGLYSKLAAGIIFETVATAESIRGCNLLTPKKDFEVWEKSLRSFELLGLNVGFLRTRLRKVRTLVFDSEEAAEARRYLDAKSERSQVEDEIYAIEEKLVELKELCAKYDHELKSLETKAESFDANFQEEVNAPW